MATYTFSRVIFGVDGTQNVTTADTVNYSITGGGISYGTIVHSATNCTVTVNTQASGGGTESGTVTFSSTGSYSVTWTQLDDKFDSYSVTLSGTVSAAATPPDTSVTLTTVTSARNFNPAATSATLSFSNGTQGHQYRLRTYDAGANNGTAIALTTANSSGNFAFSVSSTYLPVAEGDTKWYSLYAANPVANGGTGVFSYVSATSVVNILNLTRRLATPTLVVSDDDAASANVGIILNITNNSTATPDQVVLRQFKNGVLLGSQVTRTWTGNGNYSGNFTQPRNTGTDTYYYNAYLIETNSSSVPQNNVTAYSYSVSRPSGLNYQAGYKTPETSVSFSSTLNGSTHSWTVSSNNDGITRYRARSGSYSGSVVSSTITGNGTDSSVTGGAGTYYVTGYIPTTSGGDGADDNIGTYLVEAAESGVITGGTTATEGDSGLALTFTITDATTGTYNWKITRNSGTAETGGEISNATSGTFTGSSYTRTITWHNNSVVETGFQGESFTMTLRAGGTVGSGTLLDTHNFTLYDNDAGITANNVSIISGATSHTASFSVATGGGSISARIKDSGGTVRKTFTLVSSGADTEVVSDVPSGTSETYSIEVYNGLNWIAGDTYVVSVVPSEPTDISFSAPTTQSSSISVACTASGGSGGTLEVSENQSTWVANGSSFTFTRGSPKTIYARRTSAGGTSTTYSEPHTPDYLVPDRSITFSVSDSVIASSFEDNVIVTVNNGSAGSSYRALRTTGGNLDCGNTGYLTGTSGTITIGDAANELPTEGTTYSYTLQAQKSETSGGDGTTWYTVTSSPSTFTIEREAAPVYYVDVYSSYEQEQGFESVLMSVSGTGYRSSSGTALQLQVGDKVGFKYTSNVLWNGTTTATGFNANHWTSSSDLTLTTSYQYKTAKSGIPVDVVDLVTLTAAQGNASAVRYTFYIGKSLSPDTTISLDKDVYSISTSATSHTIIISNAGSSTNASITEYRVTDGTNTHESRTGHGSLTVTDVPPNPGFPKSYSIQARITTANGGSGLWAAIPDSSYEVIASTAAGSNDPTIDNYGLVIYDHQNNPVTSFTSGHTLLREIYAGTANLSTSTTTTVNTGISGVSSSNSVILLEGTGTVAASTPDSVPTTFSGTSVVFGRAQSSASVDFTVAQYAGNTLGASDSYGFSTKNGNNVVVLDENSIVYGVKEVLNVATAAYATYSNSYVYWVYIQLTQGAYPSASGVPIPALACTSSSLLVPPRILSNLWPDGSYRYVGIVLPKNLPLSQYKLAMLVSSEIATPSYYGGTNSNYGIEIFDSSGNTTWNSGWRQAIVNNIVDANQFTTGTNQNGNYDVTTGYDGVTAPELTQAFEFDTGLNSTSEFKSVTGLNEMDPSYTYVMGPAVTGKVSYYMGKYEDPEYNIDDYRGGGLHIPAIRINNTTSATLNMFRYSDGPIPSSQAEWGARVPTSYHAQGQFILVRIV